MKGREIAREPQVPTYGQKKMEQNYSAQDAKLGPLGLLATLPEVRKQKGGDITW